MNKKLLYVGGFELPDKNAAAHRVISNSKILHNLGFQVCFSGITHDHTISDEHINSKQLRDGVIVYLTRYPISRIEWLRYLCSIRNIKRIIVSEKITTVIAYNFPALALFRLFKYCRAKHIPVIGDCTEWDVSSGGNMLFRILKSVDTWFRMRYVHPRLDGIIAISKYLWNFYNPLNKNVVLVPPLVDKADQKWEKKHSLQSSHPVLTFAGSLGKEKDDLSLLFRCLSKVKNTCDIEFAMNIVGISKEEYYTLKNISPIPSNIQSNLVFHGKLSNQLVIALLQDSDFSIFIREHNRKTLAGFPTKFVESLASGTPVLTNESSDLKDYLVDGVNGYFLDASSESGLVNSLINILSLDKSKILKLKKNCESNFEFDFRQYIATFNQLLLNIEH